MNKKSLTILLGIMWTALLIMIAGFWHNQAVNNMDIKINDKNKIMQHNVIYQCAKGIKMIDVHIDISNWRIYQDNKKGISIKYPKTLKIVQDENGIKIEHAKSGEWAGTLEISKGESTKLRMDRLTPDENFQSIIEWRKEGYILTENSFIALTRGMFKDAKESEDKKSDLLGLGYFFDEGRPSAYIMLDASYKIKDDVWYGIIKSINIM